MSAYRDIAANQDGGPCGYLRKAVLPGESERRLFLGWPGKELEAAQLLDWWRESRALGCAMLPEAAPELLRKENRFWLSLELSLIHILLVFASPLYFWTISSRLKAFIAVSYTHLKALK